MENQYCNLLQNANIQRLGTKSRMSPYDFSELSSASMLKNLCKNEEEFSLFITEQLEMMNCILHQESIPLKFTGSIHKIL